MGYKAVTQFLASEIPGNPVSNTAGNSFLNRGAIENSLPGHLQAKIRFINRVYLNYHRVFLDAQNPLGIHFKTPSLDLSLAPAFKPVLMKISTST